MDLKAICEKSGIVCSHLRYSSEAVEKAKLIKPDLILMDIEDKQENNVIDKAEEICNEFEIPIIFFTTVSPHSYKNHRLQNRCVFQAIPFNENELVSAINRLLSNYNYPPQKN